MLKQLYRSFMKRILYIMVGLMLASVALSLTSCKGPKLKDADEAYDRGEYFDAATIYRKLYNRYNRKEDAWLRGELAFQLGMCHLKLNQGNRASAAFQNAIRYEFEDSTTLLRLAQAQQLEGQYTAAIKSYNEYLAMFPNDWEARVGKRGCELAPMLKEEGSRYIVKQNKLLNSRRADYCPMYLDKNMEYIYYSSPIKQVVENLSEEELASTAMNPTDEMVARCEYYVDISDVAYKIGPRQSKSTPVPAAKPNGVLRRSLKSLPTR